MEQEPTALIVGVTGMVGVA
ncbi:hypothetical protein Tco_1552606, partial [Tanacetum coccineum]